MGKSREGFGENYLANGDWTVVGNTMFRNNYLLTINVMIIKGGMDRFFDDNKVGNGRFFEDVGQIPGGILVLHLVQMG